jgi:hypothetical protein
MLIITFLPIGPKALSGSADLGHCRNEGFSRNEVLSVSYPYGGGMRVADSQPAVLEAVNFTMAQQAKQLTIVALPLKLPIKARAGLRPNVSRTNPA